jgi:hypothetical protein
MTCSGRAWIRSSAFATALYLGFALENVETPEAREEIMTKTLAYLIGS